MNQPNTNKRQSREGNMKSYKAMATVTTVLAALWVTDGISQQAYAMAGKIKKSNTLSVKTTAPKQVFKSTSGKKRVFRVSKPAVKIKPKHQRNAKVKNSNANEQATKSVKIKKSHKKALLPAVKTVSQPPVPGEQSSALKARERALARIKKNLLLNKHTGFKAGKTAPTAPGSQPDIYMPDTIKDPKLDPRFGWLRHQFSRQQEMDRWIRSPEHDMIDPGTTGTPGPDREPPNPCDSWESFEAYQDYWMIQDFYNLNTADNYHPDKWDQATQDKVHGALISGQRVDDETYECDGNKGGKGDKNDSSSSKKTDQEVAEPEASDIVEENPEDTQDANRDTDPEGDDPDEIRSALLAEAAYAAGTGQGSHSGGGDTPIQRSVGEGTGNGLGEIGRAHTQVTPLPEDGGPDESPAPSAADQISHTMAGGAAQSPDPGGDDPDDPRAGGVGIKVTMHMGAAAFSPVDGGQGGKPPLPSPK